MCQEIKFHKFFLLEMKFNWASIKFKVDIELCIGCGACEAKCPEVFELVDNKSQVKLDPVPEEFQEGALEAEDNCPVQAISHE